MAVPCEEMFGGCTGWYKKRFGAAWKAGAALGYTYPIPGSSVLPSWSPGIWNSVCISASASLGQFSININDGEIRLRTEQYEGYHTNHHTNILLMGRPEGYPVHGAVTDVNVFSRILSEEEVGDWARCGGQPGDILDWRTAQLNITKLETKEGNERVGCYQEEPTNFVSFKPPRDYKEILQFCENIGAVIAVASNTTVFDEMFQANKEVCPSKPFYLGYTDRRKEGTFIDSVSGAPLGWENWRPGEPNNWGGDENCMATHPLGLGFNDISCNVNYCPLCQLKFRKQKFQLRGVCNEMSAMDRFYVLTRREEFLGVSASRIILNQQMSRWEIVDFNNKILAFSSDDQFPLGVREWQFLHLNCSDPGTEGTHRTLNLHRDLPEPGNFCCDFGTCIDSELVCNNLHDCEDKSDEENCSLVMLPPHYKKYRPPVSATFTLIDIIDINEEEFAIDICFSLLLKWFDENLKFSFLKRITAKNSLSPDISDKIWLPKIDFKKVNKKIDSSDTQISISRNGEPALSGENDLLHPREVYEGRENPLNLNIEERFKFSCSFDNIKNFPFGQQTCALSVFIKGTDNNLTTLIPEKFINKGPKEIGQFLIHGWKMEGKFDEITERNIIWIQLGKLF